jgi:hypothetical protein
MKNLKTLLVPVGLIALVIAIFSFTNPEAGENDKECTVKIIKIVDGIETVIDSTFDCDEDMNWVSSLEGMEGSIKEMMQSIMIEGDSGEFNFNFEMDFDEDDKKGVKVMKFKAGDGEEKVEMDFDFKMLDGKDGVMKMVINGEEMEIKVDDIHKHIETLHGDMDFVHDESGNVEILIENDEDGEESHSVKIIKTIDDDGNVSVKKIVNGEEEEMDGMESVGKHHKMMFIDGHSLKDGSNSFTIDLSVDSEDGEDKKKVVIISKIITDEKSNKKGAETKRAKMKELSVENLKLSPNPNDGKFDLSFDLDKKKPVTIKIIDMQGKEVYNEKVSNFEGSYFKNIDISENKEGVYILGIKQGNKLKSSKMVIK